MQKIMKIVTILSIALLALSACEAKTNNTKLQKTTATKTTATKTTKIKVHTKKDFDLSGIYKDSAKITPSGKYMIIIFNSSKSLYCIKLQSDISNSKKLIKELKYDFTTYLLDTRHNRTHKLQHQGKYINADTKTLIDIYGVRGIPTLVFTDKKGESILMVPGYMPTKQFLVTLDFIKEKKWLSLNRQNGDVYKALKKYYLANNIHVRKKSKK